MTVNKEKTKRKRGGQPKYPGEEQQRLSVLMRPRYKQALEFLAKKRQTTISEAAEFAIAYMAMRHEVDERPLLDYTRPHNEICKMLFEASDISIIFTEDEIREHNLERLEEIGLFKSNLTASLTNTPASFRTPLENYQIRVIATDPIVLNALVIFFDIESLKAIAEEGWKSSYPVETLTSYIKVVSYFLSENCLSLIQQYKNDCLPHEQTETISELGGLNVDESINQHLSHLLNDIKKDLNNLQELIVVNNFDFDFQFESKINSVYEKYQAEYWNAGGVGNKIDLNSI